ncbi:hypothetical protein GCM10010201_31690 [Pilimelia columellifera subsp. columellifera]|uniref:DUF5753 domain-containing protein n=1 Tax=Pilimelia columellifera subsp. columellifera TaxID=706583 RepID=A0ABN3NRF1_9ACTN
MHVILEDRALWTWMGTADVQAEQLTHLLVCLTLPHVQLGILPATGKRTAIPMTGFWIFDTAVVAIETPSAAITITQPQEGRAWTVAP